MNVYRILSARAAPSLAQPMLALGRCSRPTSFGRVLRPTRLLRLSKISVASKSTTARQPPAPTLSPYQDPTTPGEKKLLQPFDHEHFGSYRASTVESSWYQWWEKSGFFQPQPNASSDSTFVIPLPPPNVTGALHCGHAMANSIQDALVRWYRMRGFCTLWVPGCDHAGISTQSVVEKMLWKRKNKTRVELGRDEFTKLVWDWKGDYHQRINDAQRRLGGSMDWSREAFTMDENCTRATMEAFCRLHEEGLIYRSNRLVNWCTHLQTALSSLEVENVEIPGRTSLEVPGYEKKVVFGEMTYFRYPIEGAADSFIEVATTRPETMLGDTGIAVHPDDERYTHLIGKHARHPFTSRLLKIVADSYVDRELGTGAVKLTPAHDYNDCEIAKRHDLDSVNILNGDGTMNENAGPSFQGKKRFHCRSEVVEQLAKLGLFVKTESHAMSIPICEKTRDVIEPLMKKQWWVKMDDMAAEALKAVEREQIKITPQKSRRSYQQWLSDINDWCISRQLWWGHRIPAYRVVFEGQETSEEDEGDQSHWIVGRTPDEAQAKATATFPGREFHLEQDPDCLDTWFSSGLWPMAILGWPKDTPDFQKFFPANFLETGWDIMFFWVARMVMLSLKLTGSVPFREVFCHGLVRDSEGRKMSKSLGNVIDPMDVIRGIGLNELHAKLEEGNLKKKEINRAKFYQRTSFPNGIPECGADVLRLTLISKTTSPDHINLDIPGLVAHHRFANKMWQASKFIISHLPEGFQPVAHLDVGRLSVAEKWIMHQMNCAVREVNEALENRHFSVAADAADRYFKDELCDIFIEQSKRILWAGDSEGADSVQQTLYRALDVGLRLFHPFMPFITEELWQRLPRASYEGTAPSPSSIMLAPYPTYDQSLNFSEETEFYQFYLQCAHAIRSLTSEYKVDRGGRAFIKILNEATLSHTRKNVESITALFPKRLATLELLGPDDPLPAGCAIYPLSSNVIILLQIADTDKDVAEAIKELEAKIQAKRRVMEKGTHIINQIKAEMNNNQIESETENNQNKSEVKNNQIKYEMKKIEKLRISIESYEMTLEEFAKIKPQSEKAEVAEEVKEGEEKGKGPEDGAEVRDESK